MGATRGYKATLQRLYTGAESGGGMDIRQMQWFAEVARVGSFNKAAEGLFITRQALSKAVAKLEDETGLRLLDADHRGVRLTAEGATFLNEITPLLSLYEQVENRYRGPHRRAVLEIALGKGTIYPFPSDFVTRFMEAHPGSEVHLEEIHSVGTLRMVEAGDAEIGILCTHPKYLAGFEMLELMHPGYSVNVPESSDLAACDRIALEQLNGQPFVTLGERNHLHRFFMEQCEKAGVRPDIIASTSDMGMFEQVRVQSAALSFGCTPTPDGTCLAARLVPLDMEDTDKFGSYAIRRPGVAPSPLARAFWEYMEAYAREALGRP